VALYATAGSSAPSDVMTTSIAERVVVDVNVDGQDVGLGINLMNTTCLESLTRVIESKAVWWYNTISVRIIIVLIQNFQKKVVISLLPRPYFEVDTYV